MPLRPTQTSHLRATAVAVCVTVLWSSSWILIRVGLDDDNLPPLTFAGLRYAFAAIVLAAWTMSRGHSRAQALRLDRAAIGALAGFGVVLFAITQGAQFIAIDSQPAATTSLLLAPTPLLVAFVAGRSIGERSSRQQLLGAALIVAGALVYFAGDLGATVIGMTAATIGLLANTAAALIGRSINRSSELSPVVVSSVSMTIGAAALLMTALAVEGVPDLTGRALLIVIWLAVVNTALAFTWWNWSQRRLAAVESAAINNTMLIQIAVLAWVFLGEAPGLGGAVGILIVSAGALITTVTVRPRVRATIGS